MINPTPTQQPDDPIDNILEGLYRWTINAVNEAIVLSKDGLMQPILGTGKARPLSPSEARDAMEQLCLARDKAQRQVLLERVEKEVIDNDEEVKSSPLGVIDGVMKYVLETEQDKVNLLRNNLRSEQRTILHQLTEPEERQG